MKCHLDFETRSECDLRKWGSWIYSLHPSTKILTFIAIDENGTLVHTYEQLRQYAENPEVIFHAYNVGFERSIWTNILHKRRGFPDLPTERWMDTQAKVRAHALPPSLDNAGAALNLKIQKDKEGHALMMRLCNPKRSKEVSEEELRRLRKYCLHDVLTEKLIDETLPDLNSQEKRIWQLDQEINFRGVQVDINACHRAIAAIDIEKQRLLKEFQEITGYYCKSPKQVAKTLEWLEGQDVKLPNLQKNTIVKQLANGEQNDAVARVLEIRQQLSKSSTAKYEKFIGCTDNENRLRLNVIYHGASTGRWTGAGVQLQNLTKGSEKANTIHDTH